MSPDQVRLALEGKLPEDIVVRAAELVGEDFHARHSCVARRYVYRVSTDKTALYRRHLSHSKYRLDIERMAAGAQALLGKHDFSSFAPASLDESVSPVCTVSEAAFSRDGNVISFEIKADRFLHHMVRNIVGTLMEVGRGRNDPEQLEEIVCKKDRRAAGPTAPARGLVLMEAYFGVRDCL
jgi:tRNA pseudouridine38-40 synthase